MAIFQQNIPILGEGVSPTPEGTLNTAGYNSGDGMFSFGGNFLNKILGRDKVESFYTDFYNNFLTTLNSPPINNLWIVFIDKLPTSTFLKKYTEREGSVLTPDVYKKAYNESVRPRGIIIAQGVKHVGEGLQFKRDGYNATGLWKGIISGGRSDIEQFNISFLETNLSFVDYAIRPWLVAISHEGLTQKSLIANNITVWHLSKMGARTNMVRRKVIKYHHCFPTNVDSQEYNYSGDDVRIQRQVQFGFLYYTLEDPDLALLNLLSYSDQPENKIIGFLKDQANRAVDNLKSQFGANNIVQYLNNIVERGKSFATSLVSNTVQGVVTNVAGAVQGAVDGAIRGLTSKGLSAGVKAVNKVADATNKGISSITGANPNKDTPRGAKNSSGGGIQGAAASYSEKVAKSRLEKVGYVHKEIKQDDTVTHELLNPTFERLNAPEIDTNKQINQRDVPIFETPGVIELSEGGITIPRERVSGDVNKDTPMYMTGDKLLFYKERKINPNDVPIFRVGLTDSKSTGGINKGISNSANTLASNTENNVKTQIQINQNDSIIGNELIRYIEKEISQNDSNIGKNVKFTEKATNLEDAR